MSEKKIVIEIGEEGEIHAETFGMEGTECVEELDKLMKDLARSGDSRKKPEYFQSKTKPGNTVTNKRQ